MIESTVEVNTRAQLNCRYARNEALRGIACMRIEYSGVLMIGSSRVGSITGTIWFDRSSGDVVQERIAREAVVYVPRREGIVQWRIKEEESLEKVHQGG